MAYLGKQFIDEFKNVAPEESFTPVPPGTYQMEVIKTEQCTTKSGNGEYIKAQMKILAPAYQGRVVFKNFNIKHSNPKAEQIGRSQLKQLSLACRIVNLEDDEQLWNIPFVADVTIRKGDGQYADQNEVKGFRRLGSDVPPPPVMHTQEEHKPMPTSARGSFSDAFAAPSQAKTQTQNNNNSWDFSF